MTDNLKTIQLLQMSISHQSPIQASLIVPKIENIPPELLYGVEDASIMRIGLMFRENFYPFNKLTKREDQAGLEMGVENDNLTINFELNKKDLSDIVSELLEDEEPCLDISLLINLDTETEEGSRLAGRKIVEGRRFEYKLSLNDFGTANTTNIEGEACVQSQTNEGEQEAPNTDQAKLIYKLTLSEPLIKETEKEENKELNSLRKRVKPSFQVLTVLKRLVRTAKELIPLILTDYLNTSGSNSNYEDFKKFNAFTDQQKLNLINTRKASYLKEFFVSGKHNKVHASLLAPVEALVFDRLCKKILDPKNNEDVQNMLHKTQFKVNKILNYIVCAYLKEFHTKIPFDILHFHNDQEKETEKRELFFSDTNDFFYMKAKEYEKVGLIHVSEKMLKDRLVNEQDNAELWHSLCRYYLRQQNYLFAETCHKKVLELGSDGGDLGLLTVSFYLQRKHLKRAERTLLENLERDKWSLKDNLLLSHLYEQNFDKPKLAKKYFNVAQKKFLYGYRKNSKEDPMLPEDVWTELVAFLNKYHFVLIAKQLTDKLTRRSSFRSLVLGNIESVLQNYSASNEYLTPLIKEETNPYMPEALITMAYNCYFLDHHYEAETLFLNYLRKTKNHKYYDVLLLLGYSYLRRRAFAEAKSIFEKLVSLNKKSVCAWFGLTLTQLQGGGDSEKIAETLINSLKLDRCHSDIPVAVFLNMLDEFGDKAQYRGCVTRMFDILCSKEIENIGFLETIESYFAKHGLTTYKDRVSERIKQSKNLYKDFAVNKEWLTKSQLDQEIEYDSIRA